VAFREINYQWILGSFGRVILSKLYSQPPSLATHDCISLRVVVRLTTKNGNSYGCFLQVLAVQSCLDDKGEELDKSFGAADRPTFSDTV